MGEGYKNCKPGDVPSETVWTEPEPNGRRHLISWGGPCAQAGKGWGAPFRRIYDKTTARTQFARYVNTDEAVGEDRDD